jgi:hypothetical protein
MVEVMLSIQPRTAAPAASSATAASRASTPAQAAPTEEDLLLEVSLGVSGASGAESRMRLFLNASTYSAFLALVEKKKMLLTPGSATRFTLALCE